MIASGGGEILDIWNVQTRETLHTLQADSHFIHTCAFSPDNRKVISGSHDKTIKVWDLEKGKELKSLCGFNEIRVCIFSPDAKHIISGDDMGALIVWDTQTGERLHILDGHNYSITACSFSPEGRHIVSAGSEGILTIWNAQTWEELRNFNGHSRWVCACTWSPDGKWIISGSEDNTIKIWNAFSVDEPIILSLHGSIRNLSTHPWKPAIVCNNNLGGLQQIDLFGFEYGPIITNPFLKEKKLISVALPANKNIR